MGTRLYWVRGLWPGGLALAARPRGGDWLEDEIAEWRREGVATVVSLLTADEETDLGLAREAAEVNAQGVGFISFPIPDRQVPDSEAALSRLLTEMDAQLCAGKNIALHCRQGIGRTGLVAACLLLTRGLDVAEAVRRLSAVRSLPVPETKEQMEWIQSHSKALAPSS